MNHKQIITVKIMITLCFLCVFLGAFYSFLLSPQEKAKTLMMQAHQIYNLTEQENNIAVINQNFDRINQLTKLAKQYDLNNEVIKIEIKFFETARATLENKTEFSSIETENTSTQ